MLIEENIAQITTAVTGYSQGVIEAGGEMWSQPIILKSDSIQVMGDKKVSELQFDDFFQAASGEEILPEVIIVGTGEQQQFIHPQIMAQITAYGVGLACMNTASACRTLVLLQGEGRSVWAWLWP